MTEPWYKEGLSFSCTRCGNCCTGEPGFVWVNDAELAAIAAFRGDDLQELTALYTKLAHKGHTLREKVNGDCVFFDRTDGCTIYPVRPRQCRTWPFWESTAATAAAWQSTQAICPGAGKGVWVPAEEITRRINTIRI